jgi:hypothetical protein
MLLRLPRLAALLPISALAALGLNASFSLGPLAMELSFSPKGAEASTSLELSLADLLSKANLVVTGTPLDQTSLWEDSEGGRGRRIVTYTRVRVDTVIDDTGTTQAGSEVWVRTLGGAVGDIGQHVDGEAVLSPETRALMFLRRRSDGTHAVVGMSQGHYPLAAPVRAGEPVKILAPRTLGHLVESRARPPTDQPEERQPARMVLPGKTLVDATNLIVVTRRSHAL